MSVAAIESTAVPGTGGLHGYRAKACFFDTQVREAWSYDPYTREERGILREALRTAGIRRGMRVLEPGCGTGRLTELLADAVGPSGGVTALDVSAGMIEACRSRVSRRENVEVVESTLEAFVARPGSYDLVVCHNILPHFHDKDAALKKLSKALKVNGTLLVFHFLRHRDINDVRRKVHDVVRSDFMPSIPDLGRMLQRHGLTIDVVSDAAGGFLVTARREPAQERTDRFSALLLPQEAFPQTPARAAFHTGAPIGA